MGTLPTRVLTIGSSCLNRFQFDFFQDRHPGTEKQFVKSLFDWNITSLVGTETVLRLAAEKSLLPVLQDASLYDVEWDVLIFNRQLPGVCFYHEVEIARDLDAVGQRDVLISKLTHQAAPFLAPDYDGHTHLVWSNIQPNLPDTVDNVTPWESFQLTPQRYASVTSLARDVFGPETAVTFLSHPDDVAAELIGKAGVRAVDLPRGDGYKGPPDLFEILLRDIVLQPQV